MFCKRPACVKADYVMQNAHKFEDLALGDLALFHGRLKNLSLIWSLLAK